MDNADHPPVNIQQAVPFFMVKSMEASLKFYIEKLGFIVAMDWTPHGKIEWCWLKRDAIAIMLQEPRKKDHWIYTTEQPGKGISICFQCLDALALYHEFTTKGVEIKEPFVGNNLWVVAFDDIDGYRLDFESPTDVPEETKYSEWVKG
ncbi:VOC family protein [Mucilaginibacter sp. X5P1]|uniref:VOC family protein n=1 Tax=Mucilaginibacter sp. X5P1 TaxID=2723088 RepID=UPI001609C865|nr:VOC family protein [Mucilaginibacter sp. X5P1]MBB6139471.1 putative lactoylglutathione lyase [Mucilaginibacter sp. X5P1]